MEKVYRSLPLITNKAQALEVLNNGSYKDLMLLPLSLGESFPDWKFAQDLCIRLTQSEDAALRANAVLGLAYIARNKGMLEKHLVKPVILRELRENIENRWRIEDAIDDINIFLKWNLKYTLLE